MSRILYFLIVLVLSCRAATFGADLEEIPNCRLVPTDWADGDSFLVKTPAGEEFTVRLYGADCIELQVNTPTAARRLRTQRRYFGITEVDGDPQASIQLAKSFGQAAKDEMTKLLAEPFTIHTSFADGRGDGKYKRVYAFVSTPSHGDLASHLVLVGLARAYGICRSTPDGSSQSDYREQLKDLELQAAKRGQGVWKNTDWDQLPEERRKEREEDEELSLALDGRGKLPEGARININDAARDELMLLPGIGETMANRIIEGRPYAATEDLLKVHGIGGVTLEKLRGSLEVEL